MAFVAGDKKMSIVQRIDPIQDVGLEDSIRRTILLTLRGNEDNGDWEITSRINSKELWRESEEKLTKTNASGWL